MPLWGKKKEAEGAPEPEAVEDADEDREAEIAQEGEADAALVSALEGAEDDAATERAAIQIQALQRGKQGRREAAEKSASKDGPATECAASPKQSQASSIPKKSKPGPAEPAVSIAYDEAVILAQEGDTSFAVLAALSRQRDQMLSELEDTALDELVAGGQKPQAKRMLPGDQTATMAREMRRVFLQFCRDRRGSGLRAWRLDLDVRGINRVPYANFTENTMKMGLSLEESMLVWRAYRPPNKLHSSLSFHEFDPAEWANLNQFLEILWTDFNFDIDLVWSYFDKNGNGSVSLTEFEDGAQSIGFRGHAQRIFYGLDSAGNGKMWKETMYYLFMLQPESHVSPEDSPLIREFLMWARTNKLSATDLCEKMGLISAGSSMSIHSSARKLQQLGFKGNCLHTSVAFSRCNQFVNRKDIVEVMGGSNAVPAFKQSKTYAGRCMLMRNEGHAISNDGVAEKPAWDSTTSDVCSTNKSLGTRERHYFSIPFQRPVREQVLSRLKKVVEPARKPRPHEVMQGSVGEYEDGDEEAEGEEGEEGEEREEGEEGEEV